MFGLMQFHSCHKTDEERAQHRLLYCGTCKAIGTLYGQSSRVFLNNDVVFLAQLLEKIAPAQIQMNIGSKSAFRNFNCMLLPQEAEIPQSMRVASAVCVTLAALKVEDHLEDTKSGASKLTARVFSKQFRTALEDLVAVGFPSTVLQELTQRQSSLERSCNDLDSLAEETAEVSAVVFQHAAQAVGAASEFATTMRDIGHAFGKLIYLLDALEDFKKDRERGQFNAISTAFGSQQARTSWLPESILDLVTTKIAIQSNKVLLGLLVLPIDTSQFVDHKNTLQRNLLRRIDSKYESWGYFGRKHRLSHKLGIFSRCDTRHDARHEKLDFAEACKPVAAVAALDFRYAFSRARELTSNRDCHLAVKLLSPIIFGWVFFVAFAAPSHSRLAQSYQEHLQLSFNLIFWGAVAAALIQIAHAGKQKVQYAFSMVGGDSQGGSHGDSPEDRSRREPERSRPYKDADDEETINIVESDSATGQQETPVLREVSSQQEGASPQQDASSQQQEESAQQQEGQQHAGEQLFRKAQEQLLLQAQQQLLAQAQQEELERQRQRQSEGTRGQTRKTSANRWPKDQSELHGSASEGEPENRQGHTHSKGRFQRSRRMPKSAYPGAAAGCLFCDSCAVCGEDAYYGTTARRSRGECCCLDCDDCCACGLEGGCDICSSSGGECCTSGECCAGGHCCAAEHCCAGADCCSAADCAHCGCGLDCCTSVDCCTAIDCGAASC